MKILYFSQGYSPHDYRFLSALVASGIDVCYLRLEESREKLELRALPPEVEQLGALDVDNSIHWMEYPRILQRTAEMVKPDLIHAGPVQKCAYLVALAGLHPLLTLSWGWDLLVEADKNPWMVFATNYTLKCTDILAADCRAVLAKAAALDFPMERTVLFPWGVDLIHFSPSDRSELRQELGWQENFVLLSLRSWEPLYGVDVVIKGFSLAAKAEPSLRLILLGDGSQADIIQDLVRNLHLEEKVHFGGRIGQDVLPAYYHAADLYLSASHSDGSSVSLMEALACGVPVIVSDIPGNREWIGDGEAGWIFPDGDFNALAEEILRAYHNQKEMAVKGKKARILAEDRADWTKNFPILLEGYQKALSIRGSV